MRGAGLPPLERYLAFSSYYTTTELQSLLTPDLAAELSGYDPLGRPSGAISSAANGLDELSRLLYLDAKTFLPCLNLTYTDKMSMAASVEVRVPLLDDELVASREPDPVATSSCATGGASTSSRRARSACCRATSSGGARPGSGRRSARGWRATSPRSSRTCSRRRRSHGAASSIRPRCGG